MMEPVRFILRGDSDRAMAYTRRASVLLDDLLRFMKFQGLSQLTRRVRLVDGTEVVLHSAFGQHQVTIIPVPLVLPEPKVEEGYKLFTDIYVIVVQVGSSPDDFALVKYCPVTNTLEGLLETAVDNFDIIRDGRISILSCPVVGRPRYRWHCSCFYDVNYRFVNEVGLVDRETETLVFSRIVYGLEETGYTLIDWDMTTQENGFVLEQVFGIYEQNCRRRTTTVTFTESGITTDTTTEDFVAPYTTTYSWPKTYLDPYTGLWHTAKWTMTQELHSEYSETPDPATLCDPYVEGDVVCIGHAERNFHHLGILGIDEDGWITDDSNEVIHFIPWNSSLLATYQSESKILWPERNTTPFETMYFYHRHERSNSQIQYNGMPFACGEPFEPYCANIEGYIDWEQYTEKIVIYSYVTVFDPMTYSMKSAGLLAELEEYDFADIEEQYATEISHAVGYYSAMCHVGIPSDEFRSIHYRPNSDENSPWMDTTDKFLELYNAEYSPVSKGDIKALYFHSVKEIIDVSL